MIVPECHISARGTGISNLTGTKEQPAYEMLKDEPMARKSYSIRGEYTIPVTGDIDKSFIFGQVSAGIGISNLTFLPSPGYAGHIKWLSHAPTSHLNIGFLRIAP